MSRRTVNIEFNQTVCGLAALLVGTAMLLIFATAELGNPLIAAFISAAVAYGIAYASPKGAAMVIVLGALVLTLSYAALTGESFAEKMDFLAWQLQQTVN
jgi:hypothetical protein